ncbi:MAG: (2Fe-2S)-binding protein [Acidobacteriia bacterium]|nr:(2Fe-2S)-binding protein [Terriglobia bacterium]
MNTMEIHLQVNGESKRWSIAPGDLLLDVLRREGYFGVKRGCERGECGACTVLLDGKAVNACLMFAAQADGREILTIEGLAQGDRLDPLQEAFLDHGAVQCGFCAPGMLLNARALLMSNPDPTEDEVRDALSGNMCRCTGYVKPVEAVLAAARAYRRRSKAARTGGAR